MGGCCSCKQELRFKRLVNACYPKDEDAAVDLVPRDAIGRLNVYILHNPERIPRVCRKLKKLLDGAIAGHAVRRVQHTVFILRELLEGVSKAAGVVAGPGAHSVDLIDFYVPSVVDMSLGLLALRDSELRIAGADLISILTLQLVDTTQAVQGGSGPGGFGGVAAGSEQSWRRVVAGHSANLIACLSGMCTEGINTTSIDALHVRYASLVAIGNVTASLVGCGPDGSDDLLVTVLQGYLSLCKSPYRIGGSAPLLVARRLDATVAETDTTSDTPSDVSADEEAAAGMGGARRRRILRSSRLRRSSRGATGPSPDASSRYGGTAVQQLLSSVLRSWDGISLGDFIELGECPYAARGSAAETMSVQTSHFGGDDSEDDVEEASMRVSDSHGGGGAAPTMSAEPIRSIVLPLDATSKDTAFQRASLRAIESIVACAPSASLARMQSSMLLVLEAQGGFETPRFAVTSTRAVVAALQRRHGVGFTVCQSLLASLDPSKSPRVLQTILRCVGAAVRTVPMTGARPTAVFEHVAQVLLWPVPRGGSHAEWAGVYCCAAACTLSSVVSCTAETGTPSQMFKTLNACVALLRAQLDLLLQHPPPSTRAATEAADVDARPQPCPWLGLSCVIQLVDYAFSRFGEKLTAGGSGGLAGVGGDRGAASSSSIAERGGGGGLQEYFECASTASEIVAAALAIDPRGAAPLFAAPIPTSLGGAPSRAGAAAESNVAALPLLSAAPPGGREAHPYSDSHLRAALTALIASVTHYSGRIAIAPMVAFLSPGPFSPRSSFQPRSAGSRGVERGGGDEPLASPPPVALLSAYFSIVMRMRPHLVAAMQDRNATPAMLTACVYWFDALVRAPLIWSELSPPVISRRAATAGSATSGVVVAGGKGAAPPAAWADHVALMDRIAEATKSWSTNLVMQMQRAAEESEVPSAPPPSSMGSSSPSPPPVESINVNTVPPIQMVNGDGGGGGPTWLSMAWHHVALLVAEVVAMHLSSTPLRHYCDQVFLRRQRAEPPEVCTGFDGRVERPRKVGNHAAAVTPLGGVGAVMPTRDGASLGEAIRIVVNVAGAAETSGRRRRWRGDLSDVTLADVEGVVVSEKMTFETIKFYVFPSTVENPTHQPSAAAKGNPARDPLLAVAPRDGPAATRRAINHAAWAAALVPTLAEAVQQQLDAQSRRSSVHRPGALPLSPAAFKRSVTTAKVVLFIDGDESCQASSSRSTGGGGRNRRRRRHQHSWLREPSEVLSQPPISSDDSAEDLVAVGQAIDANAGGDAR